MGWEWSLIKLWSLHSIAGAASGSPSEVVDWAVVKKYLEILPNEHYQNENMEMWLINGIAFECKYRAKK